MLQSGCLRCSVFRPSDQSSLSEGSPRCMRSAGKCLGLSRTLAAVPYEERRDPAGQLAGMGSFDHLAGPPRYKRIQVYVQLRIRSNHHHRPENRPSKTGPTQRPTNTRQLGSWTQSTRPVHKCALYQLGSTWFSFICSKPLASPRKRVLCGFNRDGCTQFRSQLGTLARHYPWLPRP